MLDSELTLRVHVVSSQTSHSESYTTTLTSTLTVTPSLLIASLPRYAGHLTSSSLLNTAVVFTIDCRIIKTSQYSINTCCWKTQKFAVNNSVFFRRNLKFNLTSKSWGILKFFLSLTETLICEMCGRVLNTHVRYASLF